MTENKTKLIMQALEVFDSSLSATIDTVVNIRDTIEESVAELGHDAMLEATLMQARKTHASLCQASADFQQFRLMMLHITDVVNREESHEGEQERQEADQ